MSDYQAALAGLRLAQRQFNVLAALPRERRRGPLLSRDMLTGLGLRQTHTFQFRGWDLMEREGVILAYAGRGQLWTREGVTVAHSPLRTLTLQHLGQGGNTYQVRWKHFEAGEHPGRGPKPQGWYFLGSETLRGDKRGAA